MSTDPPPTDQPPEYPQYPAPTGSPPGGLQAYPADPPVDATAWGPPGPAPGLMYAGFMRRFLGYLLDTVLLTVVELPVTLPVLFIPTAQFINDHPVASGKSLPPFPSDLTNRYLVLGIVGAVVSGLYFGGLVAWQGRTLGQRVAGTFVVRAEDGGRLPLDRAFLRAIVFWGPGLVGFIPAAGNIAGIVAFVALISVAWDRRKQGWHDKLGRSFVVMPVRVPPGYPR
ncbi:MAG TPA: RDD family protein [Candidatus Dormibacteraeota bacterium]|nr:RDD family protein [Candidatus Dormibacteraeota bacterium]